jgi:hypothetical protein
MKKHKENPGLPHHKRIDWLSLLIIFMLAFLFICGIVLRVLLTPVGRH